MIALNSIEIEWIGSEKKLFIDVVKKNTVNNEEINTVNLSEKVKMTYAIKNDEIKGERPAIALVEDEPLFFALQLRENTDYICEITLPYNKEDIEKEVTHLHSEAWPFINSDLENIFSRDDKRYWNISKLEDNKVMTKVTGRLNFKNHVGIADLRIGDLEKLFIEVVSPKLDYYGDFKLLLNDISEQMVDLLLQIGESTGVNFQSDYTREPEDYVKMFHLRQLFQENNLPNALEAMMRNPHYKIITDQSKVKLTHIRNPDIHLISSKAQFLAYQVGGPLHKQFVGYTPIDLYETNKYGTLDTPENRYIKNFIEEILADCQRISIATEKKLRIEQQSNVKWMRVYNEINYWISSLYNTLSHPMWRTIGVMKYIPSNSQVLQKREGYRDILRLDLKYRLALSLNWDENIISDQSFGNIKPIYELYEIWCCLSLRNVLSQLFGMESDSNLWKITGDKLSVNLQKGKASKSSFQGIYKNQNITVDFYYNRTFTKGITKKDSYSINFKPDYTLHFQLPDYNIDCFVHFDAKYGFTIENKSENIKEAKRTHIEKMHVYKDAIYSTLGAYVLYPGTEKEIYSQEDELIPGVGVFPLRPGRQKNDESQIQDFIIRILDIFLNRVQNQ